MIFGVQDSLVPLPGISLTVPKYLGSEVSLVRSALTPVGLAGLVGLKLPLNSYS